MMVNVASREAMENFSGKKKERERLHVPRDSGFRTGEARVITSRRTVTDCAKTIKERDSVD